MIIDVKEFEFKDQRYFVSRQPVGGKDRKIWLENHVGPHRMKINCKDLGDRRWLCRAEIPPEKAREFEAWVNETLNERCLMRKEFEYDPDGSLRRIYEIRGGDINDRTLLVLRWK